MEVSLLMEADLHIEDLLVNLLIGMGPCLMRNLSLLNSSIDVTQVDVRVELPLPLPMGPLLLMAQVRVEVTPPHLRLMVRMTLHHAGIVVMVGADMVRGAPALHHVGGLHLCLTMMRLMDPLMGGDHLPMIGVLGGGLQLRLVNPTSGLMTPALVGGHIHLRLPIVVTQAQGPMVT